MRLTLALRIALVVVGVLLAMGGALGRTLERTSAYDGVLEVRVDGTAIVTEYDSLTASYVIVFEGTREEAESFLDVMRGRDVDFTVPNTVIAVGMVLVAAGFVGKAPRRNRHRIEDETFQSQDLHDELRAYYGR